jgi:transposase
MTAWAGKIGPSVAEVAGHILRSRQYPEQGFRACLGLIRLARRYPEERVEAACVRALALNACTYKSVKSILENGLDHQPTDDSTVSAAHDLMHENIRGAAYYAQEVGHDA